MLSHLEIENKLHEEVDRVFGGRDPAYEDIANLKYTTVSQSLCIPLITKPTSHLEDWHLFHYCANLTEVHI